jgi:hypothetical protein
VDHSVGGLCPGAKALEIVEIAPVDLRTCPLDSLRRRIRAGQTQDVVTCGDEFRNNG